MQEVKRENSGRFSVSAGEENGAKQGDGDTKTISVAKNYVPIRKRVEGYCGYDIKSLSSIGGEIDSSKPVYLFSPELGSVSIHALAMSLKSYKSGNIGETVCALNTLLVITSDSNYTFRLSDCPELLDSLSEVGLLLVRQIVDNRNEDSSYVDIEDLPLNNNVDKVFDSYVNKNSLIGEDIGVTVDSLTGEIWKDEFADLKLDEYFSIPEIDGSREQSEKKFAHSSQETSNCFIPDYMTTLLEYKWEKKYHFSDLQTSSAVNDQIRLIDQLITVTMILRNISFYEANRGRMARDDFFKDLLFGIIKAVSTAPGRFRHARRRLCLLKSCLLILDNVAFILMLRSLEEAFLAFLLISSFGPNLSEGNQIPEVSLDVYIYLPYSVDALVKLLVREPYNRSLLYAVLTGNFSLAASSYTDSKRLNITEPDKEETKKLIVAYFSGDVAAFETGSLFVRAFRFLACVLPYSASPSELSKFIFSKTTTISQVCFGLKLLCDVPADELNPSFHSLCVRWLLTNKEPLLCCFLRQVTTLVSETFRLIPSGKELTVLYFVLTKALIFVNSLISKAVSVSSSLEDNETLRNEIAQIVSLSRVIPDKAVVLDVAVSPVIDLLLKGEVIRLYYLLNSLNAS